MNTATQFFLVPAVGFLPRTGAAVLASFSTLELAQRVQAARFIAGDHTELYHGELLHGDPWTADEAYYRRRNLVR